MEQTESTTGARKKRYHTKSYTGCVVCRIRRVKCDEERPSCQRCIRSGHACSYQQRARIFNSSARRFIPFDPQAMMSTGVQVPIHVSYGTPDSVRSLDFFLKRTAPMLSMSSPVKELWTVVIPQASWRYTAVKDILIAISMLDQYLAGALPHHLAEGGYRSALQSYSKCIRTVLATTNPTVSCLLLVSVLAWIFERLTKRPDAAAMHSRAARNIILQSASSDVTLSTEDQFVVGCLENMARTGNYIHAEGYHRPGRELQQIRDLNDARRRLFVLAKSLVQAKLVQGNTIVWALQVIHDWRDDFEAYRFYGPESIEKKRSVFLVHNIVGTYIGLLDVSLRGKRQNEHQGLFYYVLKDVEYFMEYENLAEATWILDILLRHIIREASYDGYLYSRAEKLLGRLANTQSNTSSIVT